MKRLLSILTAVVLMMALACTAAAAEEEYEPMPAGAEVFEGNWRCDRAVIEMYWEEEGFKVTLRWGSSAFEETRWEYSCFYHEDDNTLVSMPFGMRTDLVYDENGLVTSATEVYDDGEAVFSLDEDGFLIWLDEKENAGEGMRFEKVVENVGAEPENG